jgi:hypothetical protein
MLRLGEESALLDEVLLEGSASTVVRVTPLRMKGLQRDDLAI